MDRQKPTDRQRCLRISRFPLILPYKSLFLHFFCKIKSLTFLTNHKPIISLLSSLVYRSLIDMADVMRPEKLDMSNDTSSLGSPELLHVLAVDDSIVDRKFIERLLRVSSCKGKLEEVLVHRYSFRTFVI